MSHFHKIVSAYKDSVNLSGTKAWEVIASMKGLFDDLEEKDKKIFWKTMKDFHVEIKGCHFDECFAMYEVNQMYHTKQDGSVHHGEMITPEHAEQIYERYRRNVHASVTKWDIYVALNAQYHDYDNIYNQWFNKDKEIVKEKVVESAIVFWFKDEDAPEGKVWDYFND